MTGGETEAAPQMASDLALYATRPSPAQRGLEMLWEALKTTQGYKVPVAKFFPAPVLFCLERWAGLSL